MEVRVRFAPSPTGFLHIGGVRTALFNWLFARHEGGKFLLRIEDTDKERSEKRFEEDLLKNLEWLGVTWDEEEVRQSDRIALYEKHLTRLLDEHRAYYCFCSAEDLEAEHQAQLAQGIIPKYSGKCRGLTSDQVTEMRKTQSGVIRFKMPERTISFSDIIRGKVEFDTKFFGDIIIAKGVREPLYNFASVVDDADMRISHVIRGEEHLSNTPKQMMIQEALELPTPHYAHLPLILGPDKKKLSKRYLTNNINDYRTQGILPSALLNFLMLLGWHPKDDKELFSIPEMVTEFSIKRVQKAGAIYNPEKLEWFNAMHIKMLDDKELLTHLTPFIPEHWMKDNALLLRAISLSKERLKTLSDFQKEAKYAFELPRYEASLLRWKQTELLDARTHLTHVHEIITHAHEASFPDEALTASIMKYAEEKGRGNVLWPLRVALSGQDASPGPIELLSLLGKEESIERISSALHTLSI